MSVRSYFDLTQPDRSGLAGQIAEQRKRVADRLASVRSVVLVMSGKGGVGKSYVTAGLARALAGASGQAVGVLDADLRSPTVARLLDAGGPLKVTDAGVEPALGAHGIRVMSTEFLLHEGQPLEWRGPSQERFVWRGSLEVGTLREFLSDVRWGALDLLLIDLPPGADGAVELGALIPNLAGALAVTIPTDESRRSVSRTMRAAADAGVRLLGVVENMSGYHCAGCEETRPLFSGDAGARLAQAFRVPLLGAVPFSADGQPPLQPIAARLREVLA
jgi:ATP-binding protein involved in chromosome partitioning